MVGPVGDTVTYTISIHPSQFEMFGAAPDEYNDQAKGGVFKNAFQIRLSK